ncbi:FMN-binding negative transcriptional regulator [Aspergillus novofumigatus IBT 16806]|uniref:Negative transcriptional regulator n=1 Tax=Aspergillus novofumigatus (strain IBT 16806) TaxID=1392255 RepID=A0A2I1CJ79_ASPN1|nr:negative transcriptional regulator [Aspergillus novofumigatus IBT 16806]PKX97683.1 negative transcriptional regulator [Aspergillus novofumigatus IBT 16806]
MYLRAVHAETHIPLLQQFIRDNPLGILTTATKSLKYPLLQSSHIPFVLDIPDSPTDNADSDPAPGTLRGHIAKQNPQAKALMEALAQHQSQTQSTTLELPDEVLILFNGPHHHYVVPTWNYSAVQAYGKIRVYCDSKAEETGAFLSRQVNDLSRHAETAIMGYTGGERPGPWEVSNAPEPYVELLKKNIIGVEVRIERLQGKFKMRVVEGFEKLGTEVGMGIAKTVKERGN